MKAADGTPIAKRVKRLLAAMHDCSILGDHPCLPSCRACIIMDYISAAEERVRVLREALASQRNCTAQLESNIQFLNERLAAATGACKLHIAGDNTPICGTHMEQVPLNSGQCPIGGAVLLALATPAPEQPAPKEPV